MAMINRIRKRSGLLIIVIGGAMVAFILSGLFRRGCQRQGARPQQVGIGSIYGERIPKEEYQKQVDQRFQRVRQQQQEELSDEMKQRIRDQVWEEMVRKRLYGRHIQELGIEVPPEELKDLLAGENVHPRIRRIFEQQMGTFNKEMVLRRIQQSYQQNEQARQQWSQMAQGIMQDRAFSKFTDLVKKAMYGNEVEAKDRYRANNKSIDLEYVVRPYRSLADEKVDVSEEEVRGYYQEHKDDPEYEQEASRSFEYVLVDAGPSSQDIAKARKDMEDLKERFQGSRKDSLFASNQSDAPGSPIQFLRKGELEDPRSDSALFSSGVGDVVGPFLNGERFSLYKVLEKELRPDSVNVSHILLGRGVQGKRDSLMKVADSLKGELEAGASFSRVAENMSEDPQSRREGGSLGWIRPGSMLPSFDSAAFHADTGSYPIVRSQAGVHLIDVKNRTEPIEQYRTAVIEKEVSPSESTLDSAFDRAKQVSMNSRGDSSFRKAAGELGLSVQLASRVKESDRSVARIEDSRRLVRWAYKANKGQVSQAIRCGDQYVVAFLKEVREEGAPSFANVREDMRSELLQKKKAERFQEEMKGTQDLDKLASSYDLEVRSATGITFNSNSLPGAGNEPRVIGKLTSVKESDVYTRPIEGNRGVFVALITDVQEAGKPDPTRLAQIKDRIQRERGRRVERDLFEVLKEHADVEDQRNALR